MSLCPMALNSRVDAVNSKEACKGVSVRKNNKNGRRTNRYLLESHHSYDGTGYTIAQHKHQYPEALEQKYLSATFLSHRYKFCREPGRSGFVSHQFFGPERGNIFQS
ncbi:hypothetical protein NDU88_001867 [Pleurodeles waltl]|uniref:Uncharacterized protein n=1 Tax=Pleurodeles waltl TaxID=8319 RepID=A0AAV7T162_PLEWA|nr:hypothetical protein NDU88_001867 [Pleurodeles waltl]